LCSRLAALWQAINFLVSLSVNVMCVVRCGPCGSRMYMQKCRENLGPFCTAASGPIWS